MSRLREMLRGTEEVASPQLTNHMIYLGIALWVFCEIVFAHSYIGFMGVVRIIGLDTILRALSIVLFIANIARQRFDLSGPALAFLACAILAACMQWQGQADAGPLALTLVVVAARNLSISRLARWYTLGALLGVLTVMACAMLGLSRTSNLLIDSSFVPTFGFEDRHAFAYLILSIAVGIMIGAKELRTRWICATLCLPAVPIACIQLHDIPIAICFAALAVAAVASVYAPATPNRIPQFATAALPGVLFCLSYDAPRYLASLIVPSAYTSLADSYAYAVLGCMYAYYALAVLSLGNSQRDRLVRCICLMYALLLTQSTLPMSLEFNCSLLALSRGVWGLDPQNVRRRLATVPQKTPPTPLSRRIPYVESK